MQRVATGDGLEGPLIFYLSALMLILLAVSVGAPLKRHAVVGLPSMKRSASGTALPARDGFVSCTHYKSQLNSRRATYKANLPTLQFIRQKYFDDAFSVSAFRRIDYMIICADETALARVDVHLNSQDPADVDRFIKVIAISIGSLKPNLSGSDIESLITALRDGAQAMAQRGSKRGTIRSGVDAVKLPDYILEYGIAGDHQSFQIYSDKPSESE